MSMQMDFGRFGMQNTSKPTAGEQREQNIERIASITTMQPSTLADEYRQGAIGKDGKPTQLGPYYKLQVWRDGANRTSRIPVNQASHLREDIENRHTFEQLCKQLAGLNIDHSRTLRATQTPNAENGESKKTLLGSRRRKIRRNRSLHRESQSNPESFRSRRKPRMDRARPTRCPPPRRL
jgi:hypothetical protein